MHIWTLEKWIKYLDYYENDYRTGLRLKFDKNVDPEVKRACKDFAKWIRTEYYFPIRVPIYIKSCEKIRAMDGEMVAATFFEPLERSVEPFVRVAAGDYDYLLCKLGKDNALAAILASIAHELTHYFQWINGIKLTETGYERQAKAYANYIVDEYAETREHP